jgi:hypothetical protein
MLLAYNVWGKGWVGGFLFLVCVLAFAVVAGMVVVVVNRRRG